MVTTKNNQRLVADHIGHGNFIGYLKNTLNSGDIEDKNTLSSGDIEEHELLRYRTACLYYPDCPMCR